MHGTGCRVQLLTAELSGRHLTSLITTDKVGRMCRLSPILLVIREERQLHASNSTMQEGIGVSGEALDSKALFQHQERGCFFLLGKVFFFSVREGTLGIIHRRQVLYH